MALGMAVTSYSRISTYRSFIIFSNIDIVKRREIFHWAGGKLGFGGTTLSETAGPAGKGARRKSPGKGRGIAVPPASRSADAPPPPELDGAAAGHLPHPPGRDGKIFPSFTEKPYTKRPVFGILVPSNMYPKGYEF